MADAGLAERVPVENEAAPSAPAAAATPTELPVPAASPAAPSQSASPHGDWPADWRQKYAGEDADKLKRLERYASPNAAIDALFAAQNKIRSGELSAPLPDNPTPEQLSAWRKANNVPESAEKYDLSKVQIPDQFKGQVGDFLKLAHEANIPQPVAAKLISQRIAAAQEMFAQMEQHDEQQRQRAEEALIAEWGGEYTRNRNQIKALLDTAPTGLTERLLGGRLAPKEGETFGAAIGDDPDVQRWLISLARQVNPVATVVPSGAGNVEAAVEDEIGRLEKMMQNRSRTSEYWHGPNAEKNQARYRELLTARERMKK